jgi:hypothetical protein
MASWSRRPTSRTSARPGTRYLPRRISRRRRVQIRRRGMLRAGGLLVLCLLPLGWLLGRFWPARLGAFAAWLPHATGWVVGAGAFLLVLLLAGGTLYWSVGRRQHRLAHFYSRQHSLRTLQSLDPLAFEQHIARLFELEGYQVTLTPYTGDEGIDLWLSSPARLGIRRRLTQRGVWRALVGGRSQRIPVQCKRYTDRPVGSPELQAFSGAMRQALAEEGYFVTTSRFTPAAQRWAKREGMYLIDGAALIRWQQQLLPATNTTGQQQTTNNL